MMGSQQLNLKWRNHHSNLLSVFDKLLDSEALSDVTLACEGKTLKAHKMILSACSPFFHTLFAEHPHNHPIVILKDVHHRDLKAVVDFMYRGEVNICQDQLPSVLQTAELLRVKGLAESTDGSQQNRQPERQASEAQKRRKRPRTPSGTSSMGNGSLPQFSRSIPQFSQNVSHFPKIAQAAIESPKPSGNTPVTSLNPPSDGSSQSSSNWAASTETADLVEVNMNLESDIDKEAQSRSSSNPVPASISESKLDSTAEAFPGDGAVKIEEIDDDEGDDDDLPEDCSLPDRNFSDPFPHPSPGEYQLQGFKPPDQPDGDAPHELARLPRHKKKDCAVCGNRKAGMRRRSRQWCPGCNVGVHVHCFDQLIHYRRVSKRRTEPTFNLPTFNLPLDLPTLPMLPWTGPQDGSYLMSSGFPAIFGFLSPKDGSFPKGRVATARSLCSAVQVSSHTLTQFPITEDIIARCARVDPQKFVNDLLSELYSEEYLASHSVTGQKCPYKDSAQKPGFNPVELAHIIRTVQGAFIHRSLSDTEIKAYIRVKLGNASKLYARRKQNL